MHRSHPYDRHLAAEACLIWYTGYKAGKVERMELLRRKEIEPYSIHDFEEMRAYLSVSVTQLQKENENAEAIGVQIDSGRKPPTSASAKGPKTVRRLA